MFAWIDKAWKDPVWSKVIAGVISSLGAVVLSFGSPWRSKVLAWLRMEFAMPAWLLFLAVIVIGLLFTFSVLRRRRYPAGIDELVEPDSDAYEVTIDSHRDGMAVAESLEKFHGSLNRQLPNDFELWVLRRWQSKPGAYYPVKRAGVRPARGNDNYEWEADDCLVGGEPGKSDGRILELWLVGPSGRLLLETWCSWNEKYSELMKATNQSWTAATLVPPLNATANDMTRCAGITLKRK